MTSRLKKPAKERLGRSWKHLTEYKLSEQDNQIMLSVKQLVESGLEQSHETKFKGSNVDTMKKYKFDLHVPTGTTSKLGIKITRKQTVDETRLTIRKIDIHDHSFADCKRQQSTSNLKNNKLYCTLFGPNLCPDCTQISDQAEFTDKQEQMYPQISVHTRYMVAGGKLTNKKIQNTSKGLFISNFKRQVDVKAIDNVVSDEDLHKRVKRKYLALEDTLVIN